MNMDQEGDKLPFACDKIDLSQTFSGLIISRNGDIKKPPITCDLTPLD